MMSLFLLFFLDVTLSSADRLLLSRLFFVANICKLEIVPPLSLLALDLIDELHYCLAVLHQYKFTSLDSALVRPSYVSDIEEVGKSQNVEKQVLNKDLRAGLFVEPRIAHISRGYQSQRWEHYKLKERQVVIPTCESRTLFLDCNQAYNSNWQG
jgi:hypothetical protein